MIVEESAASLDMLLVWARDVMERQQRTPVLVMPDGVRLRTAFFVELGRQWLTVPTSRGESPTSSDGTRPVLWIDWCPYSSRSSNGLSALTTLLEHRIRWTLRRNRLMSAVRFHTRVLPTRVSELGRGRDSGVLGRQETTAESVMAGDCVLAVARESLDLPPWAAAFRLVA